MSRPLRINYDGGLYHITSRGNERRRIFAGDEDSKTFLNVLSHVVERFGWICHAYCLMGNHYHLLIETPKANLSDGMRQLNGVYTQLFNSYHKRVGHLFQGRFKSIIVEKNTHLLELTRYVVLNPVRAKICEIPEDYLWSSFRATVGKTDCPSYLHTDWLLSQFGDERRKNVKMYEAFVKESVGESPWNKLKGQIYLGKPEFIERLPKGDENLAEIPREQKQPIKPTLKELLKDEWGIGIVTAHRKYGYRLNEIGKHLRVHYSTVSRRLKIAENQIHHCKT